MRRWFANLALLLALPVSAGEIPLGDVRTSGEVFAYNYSPVVAANGSSWLAAWNQEAARIDRDGNVLDRPANKLQLRPMRAIAYDNGYLLVSEGSSHEVVLTSYEPEQNRETVLTTLATGAERIFTADVDTDGLSVLVTWIEYSGSTKLGIARFDPGWNLAQRYALDGFGYAASCSRREGGYLVLAAGSSGLQSRIVSAAGALGDPVVIAPAQLSLGDVVQIDAGYLAIAGSESFVLNADGAPSYEQSLASFGSDNARIACGSAECLAVSNRSPQYGDTDVTAARFARSDGRLLDSGTLAHTTKYNSRWTSGSDGVDVAWNGTRFLVVTSDGYLGTAAISTNIYGRFVEAGERISSDVPLFLISYRAVSQTSVSAAVNEGVERFVWSEPTRCPSLRDAVHCSGWALHTQAFDESGDRDLDVLISTNDTDDTTPTLSAITPDGDAFLVAFIETGNLKTAHISRDGTISDRREVSSGVGIVDAASSFSGPAIVWSESDGVHLLVHGNQLTLGTAARPHLSIASDGVGALVAWPASTADTLSVVRVDLSTLTASPTLTFPATINSGPFVAFNGSSYVVAYDALDPDYSTKAVRARRFTIDGQQIDSQPIEVAHGSVWLTSVGTHGDEFVFVLQKGDASSCPSIVTTLLLPTGQIASNPDGSDETLIATCASDGAIAKSSARRVAYRHDDDHRVYVKEVSPARLHGARSHVRQRPVRPVSP